ncbi:MAG TPA: hypothetical protein VD886_19725, partial [Herpetosiphonaceae bacterium]|nr:hypothetical protein [Herpetosiphonaceae bacterium]
MADLIEVMPQSDRDETRQRLLALSQTIAQATTLAMLLADAARESVGAFGVQQTRITVFDDRHHRTSVVIWPERDGAAPEVTPLVEQARQSHSLQVSAELPELPDYAGLKAVVLLPLIANNAVVGVWELGVAEAHQTPADDVLALGQLVAGQLGLAVSNLLLQASTAKRDQEINTLNDIAATITSTLDPRQVYRLVVQKINEYFDVEAGSLLLLDPQTEELVFVMTLEAGEEK